MGRNKDLDNNDKWDYSKENDLGRGSAGSDNEATGYNVKKDPKKTSAKRGGSGLEEYTKDNPNFSEEDKNVKNKDNES